jgi:putative transposase
MSQSLHNLWAHIIFSTKYRQRIIHPDIEPELYAYISTVLKYSGSSCLLINGDSDHIHILIRQSKIHPVPKLVEEVKKSSSRWIKTKNPIYAKFKWQNGYAAISVGPTEVERIKRYIEKQKEHHKKKNFKEEFVEYLKRHKIMYNERYIWD